MSRLYILIALTLFCLALVQNAVEARPSHHHRPHRPHHRHRGSNRIVAVGDLHSDYNNTLTVLQMAKIIDRRGNWIAGRATFIQTVSFTRMNKEEYVENVLGNARRLICVSCLRSFLHRVTMLIAAMAPLRSTSCCRNFASRPNVLVERYLRPPSFIVRFFVLFSMVDECYARCRD